MKPQLLKLSRCVGVLHIITVLSHYSYNFMHQHVRVTRMLP